MNGGNNRNPTTTKASIIFGKTILFVDSAAADCSLAISSCRRDAARANNVGPIWAPITPAVSAIDDRSGQLVDLQFVRQVLQRLPFGALRSQRRRDLPVDPPERPRVRGDRRQF